MNDLLQKEFTINNQNILITLFDKKFKFLYAELDILIRFRLIAHKSIIKNKLYDKNIIFIQLIINAQQITS